MSEQSIAAKTNASLAQTGTLAKLIVFSVSLGALPLASYFASTKYFWPGNDVYAAILAVIAANVVLGSYIIASVLEEKSGSQPAKAESKKER